MIVKTMKMRETVSRAAWFSQTMLATSQPAITPSAGIRRLRLGRYSTAYGLPPAACRLLLTAYCSSPRSSTTNSTRRFSCRPSAVSFEAMGRDSP